MTVQVRPRSANDKLGHGLSQTIAITRELIEVIATLSAAVQRGDLRARGAANRFEGLNKKHRDDPNWEELEPLYDDADAARALERVVSHAYEAPFELFEGVTVRLLDAGHVLGSASVVFDIVAGGEHRRVAFSGDIGRRNLPILRDPTPPVDADYVGMESTYGNRLHADVQRMDDQLAEVIERTRQRGGRLLIPSFALERTQEIVFALNRLLQQGRIAPLSVFVDSPLAVRLTEVFRKHPECYDTEASAFDGAHGDPFDFQLLRIAEKKAARPKARAADRRLAAAMGAACQSARDTTSRRVGSIRSAATAPSAVDNPECGGSGSLAVMARNTAE